MTADRYQDFRPSAYEAVRRTLSRFLARSWVEFSIGALILLSVGLTLLEFAFVASPRDEAMLHFQRLRLVNDAITSIFVVELTLRLVAAKSKARFFREYWLDIVAVLPLFRPFRSVRAARLLRLVRLLRLLGIAPRLASFLPYVMRRGAVEYFAACGLLFLTVIFGAGAIMQFESAAADPGAVDLEQALWFSLYSLLASEPIPDPPQTFGAKVATVGIMFMGMTIFAMFTGTVSAYMVERINAESRAVKWEELHDHIIICGWNSHGEIVAREFMQSPNYRDAPIVVVADHHQDTPLMPESTAGRVKHLNADFTRVDALEMAGVRSAKVCVLLADVRGDRTEQDADARTILGALTVEKLNPSVYTCAELHNRENGSHLRLGRVDEFVVSGEYGAYLLANAAIKHGVVSVFTELLTNQRGNEFHRISVPGSHVGRAYFEVFVELKRDYNATLVAVQTQDDRTLTNPADYTFAEGDELVVISEREFSINE